MMRKIYNPRIAMAVLFSLLMLNLSFLNLPQAQVSAQTGKRPNLGQAVTEPDTFEHKDQDGKTLARLHVSPAESSSRFQFLIEDFQTAGRADGTVEVADGALKVRFTDALSKQRLGMDFRPDPSMPGRHTITLLHNKRRCEVTIDGARAKEIAGRMQELSDQGKQEEVKQLVPLIRQTFSGGEKYFEFTKRVASSPALAMLATTAALEASLSSEQISRSLTLQALNGAVKLLAPDTVKSAANLRSSAQVRAQPRLLKASYSPKGQYRLSIRQPGLVRDELACDLCPLWFLSILVGCYFEWDLCHSLLPMVDWWLCDSIAFFCIDVAVLYLNWCIQVYCTEPIG